MRPSPVRHGLTDLPELASAPTDASVALTWTSWERVTEFSVSLRLLVVAFVLVLASLGAFLASPRPIVRFQAADGTVFDARDLRGGSPLNGNNPRDLDTVKVLAQEVAWLRSNWDATTVTARLDSIVALSTAAGEQSLLETVPMALITSIVRDDAGAVTAREAGHGAVVVGESPGHVRASVPLRGQLVSRHFPLDAPLGGLATAGTLTMWFVRQSDGWRLDKLAGDVLSSSIVTLWTRYAITTRSPVQPFDKDRPISADSAVRLAWQRPPMMRW
jgi:hypothetical protein